MKLKNLVLGIGIIIVFALVLWQGIEAFSPSPQWEDFCEESIRAPSQLDESVTKDEEFKECQEEYDFAKKEHSKIVFIVSLITALVAIILGYSILKMEPVGSSLIASGIWAIFWGSVINWRNFSSILRFLLLLIVLILLIWITLRLNSIPKKNRK